jgi:hypothetical protein
MSKFKDTLKSKGKIPLSEPLEGLKDNVKVAHGKVAFSPPEDLEEDMAQVFHKSVEALNEFVKQGVLKVDQNGKVEAKHG